MSKTITVGGESIEISDEQYNLILEEAKKDINNYEDLVGGKYFFRTVTYHTVGRVKKIVGKFALLDDASWVADSGRFMNAIKDGTLEEVEPVGKAFVNLDTVVDFFPWTHKLPTEQK
jgi:hypothetical protein